MEPLPLTAVEIAAIASPIVAAIVGLGQIAVVWYGIRAMIAANADRAEGAAAAARRADERHAENMAVLDTQRQAMEALIERTAPPKDPPRFRRQPARVL